jgi:dTDP-4-amino-4,6-dideoxygalactose transaminase
VVLPGFKYNLTDVGAAIGLHQLRAIDRHLFRRREICERYDDAFADLPVSGFDPVPADAVHAHHLYTILVDDAEGPDRDEVATRLAEQGVSSSVHFPAVHLHRFYADRYGFRRGQFPAAERIADTVLSLPLSPALSDAQVDVVIGALREAFEA